MIRPVFLAVQLVAAASFAQPLEMVTDTPAAPPNSGRIRWGANFSGGTFAPQTAVVLGAGGRIGYQFTDLFNLHADLGVQFGIGVQRASTSVMTAARVGAMAEVTAFERLSIAIGPVLANAAWASGVVTDTSTTVTSLAAGWMPGTDLKVAYSFGARDPATGRHRGFSLGLDCLTLFAPNATNTAPGGATSTGLAIGFVPTLTLGYEAR